MNALTCSNTHSFIFTFLGIVSLPHRVSVLPCAWAGCVQEVILEPIFKKKTNWLVNMSSISNLHAQNCQIGGQLTNELGPITQLKEPPY